MRMSELLNEVNRFELDEGFSPREIKMAIGIASDPRYAKGNMTGAVTAIERMKKGLSKHPQVMAVLKRQNEKVETDEAVSPAQQAAIAISKKEKGEKPKEEGNTFGKELKAARDKGEKTFVVSGKKYNVEDYDVDEEFELDEAMKQTHIVINSKGKVIGYATDEKGAKDLSKNNIRKEKGAVVKLKNPISDKKAQDMMGGNLTTDMLDKLREEVNLDEAVENILIQKGDVNKIAMQVAKNAKMLGLKSAHMGPHVRVKGAKKQVSNFMSTVIGRNSTGDATSTGMVTPMIDKMLNKSMKEEVELDEKYDLYHKDFSSAMQHAYSYAKSKMGITVDPKEIDSKVATGPKKPTEGKTNKYMLKGKGGNLQIQVYNKGGSKPFELNMYKEENELDEATINLGDHDGTDKDFKNLVKKMKLKITTAGDGAQDDVDTVVSGDSKNIIMQLRKSVSMRGNKEVEFADIGHGYKKKVDMKIAQKALDMYNKMKPQDKTKFQTIIAKSYKDLLNAIKGK